MAGTSLLALIDDIATLLDDVAVMSKVAVKKTAGVLGDDLALNAQQVTGISADRELPVVWAVAKGSFINKVILVPSALLISLVASWAILPLLMLGGLFLCYEGCEKILHKLLKKDHGDHKALVAAVSDPAVDLVAFEKDKIKGAIRTDFILSAEIVVITLGAAAASPWSVRILTLCAVALLMTVGVYGLVAGIVKLDDLGLHWKASSSAWKRKLGVALLWFAPFLMKTLGVAGTVAMFLVGGGILLHGFAHHWAETAGVLGMAASLVLGVAAGAVVLGIVEGVKRLRGATT